MPVKQHDPAPSTTTGRTPATGTWWDQAACQYTDPDLFHPDRGKPIRPAKTICADCPVRAECLTHALSAGEREGVWGGLGPEERKALTGTSRDQQLAAARRALILTPANSPAKDERLDDLYELVVGPPPPGSMRLPVVTA